MTTKSREVSAGLVSLSGKEGALYKRALLCHTGSFKGLYGPVVVTAEILSLLTDKYNRLRSQPKNENDYSPILVDHNRSAELIKGRLLPALEVGPWMNPETGVEEKGLYGNLRIDRDQEKVESGQYSQLSITFDDESFEIYEVSFVAVEAARGSQVLSQGEKSMDLELMKKQNTELSQKVTDLSQANEKALAQVQCALEARKAVSLELGQSLTAQETQVAEAQKAIQAGIQGVRTVALSSQFKGFIRQGKLTKAEFDGLKFQELSAMPEGALKAFIGSYERRTPSADIVQHGQQGAQPVDAKMTPAQLRAAIKTQLAKKPGGIASLSDDGDSKSKADGEDKKPGAEDKKSGEGKKEGDEGEKSPELQFSDIEDACSKFEAMLPYFEKINSAMKQMRATLAKLSGEEPKDEKEEKEGNK